jgi:Na+/H+ antiporter NhaC
MLAFLITGFVAFSTGTSWGTYAIMIPIAVPLAFSFSGNELDTVVYSHHCGGFRWRRVW